MKNLKPYPEDCFAFYESALAAKDSEALRLRLGLVAGGLQLRYQEYEDRFKGNDLEALASDSSFGPYKGDLLSLYNYQFSMVRALRLAIEREQPQAIRYTCQHCTLTSNESLDHFVPKDEFPEFAMNPYNLLPICMKCNQYKSYVWRNLGKRTALNLYLDQLPEEQYLFVDVTYDDYGEMDFEFYLQKPNGLNNKLFTLIEIHFQNLNLFARMREKAIPVISELQNLIKSRLANLPYNVIEEEIKDTAKANMLVFGRNYWKSIVEIELVDSSPFLATLGL